MTRFDTLGTIDLVDGRGEPHVSVLTRSKRLALLAYLTVERPGSLQV